MNKKENILTKSAKEELETYLAQEKERILNEAYQKATQTREDIEEISLRDILEATDRTRYEADRQKKSEYRRKENVDDIGIKWCNVCTDWYHNVLIPKLKI